MLAIGAAAAAGFIVGYVGAHFLKQNYTNRAIFYSSICYSSNRSRYFNDRRPDRSFIFRANQCTNTLCTIPLGECFITCNQASGRLVVRDERSVSWKPDQRVFGKR